MATRRLKQPLNPSAVANANQKLWEDHPELRGRQLTMGPEDAAYRKEWVDNYLVAGASAEDEPAAPPDQVVKPCPEEQFDCTGAWKECEDAATAIVNKSNDPVQRNKYFNAAYAKLYLQDPKLEWLGAAAFASKQVGCGIKDAKTYMDIAEADRSPWNIDGPNPIIQFQGGEAKVVYEALSNGNKAVFKDIYPAHAFYEKFGLNKMKQCADTRQPPLDKKVLDGFSDIDAGHSDTGAIKILQHEQLDILQQRTVFGNQEVRDVMELNQSMSQHWYGRLFGAQETSVCFTSNCTGDPSVTFHGANPADPNERWPYAQDVVNTFDKLKDSPEIQQDLQKIIQQGR